MVKDYFLKIQSNTLEYFLRKITHGTYLCTINVIGLDLSILYNNGLTSCRRLLKSTDSKVLLQLTAITATTAIATETCGKTFKILLQSTTWNCGSEKSTQSSEVYGVW